MGQHGQHQQLEQDLGPGQVRQRVSAATCAPLTRAQGDPGHEESAR